VLTPEPQPKFFLDRSLGRVVVPALLRAAGWDPVTLAGPYIYAVQSDRIDRLYPRDPDSSVLRRA
jgi:hypothetical protein